MLADAACDRLPKCPDMLPACPQSCPLLAHPISSSLPARPNCCSSVLASYECRGAPAGAGLSDSGRRGRRGRPAAARPPRKVQRRPASHLALLQRGQLRAPRAQRLCAWVRYRYPTLPADACPRTLLPCRRRRMHAGPVCPLVARISFPCQRMPGKHRQRRASKSARWHGKSQLA